jgi:hypothetical protein
MEREEERMKRILCGVVVLVAVFVGPAAFGSAPLLSPEAGADPTATLLVEQGIKLYEMENWQDARSSFEMAISLDPGLAAASFNAGLAALEAGDQATATSHLTGFLARHPTHSAHSMGAALLSDIRNRSGDVASGGLERGWGGFAEFGIFGLLGGLFTLMLAAYDMGVEHPFTAQAERDAIESPGAEIFPFCRLRSVPASSEDERWIEAA